MKIIYNWFMRPIRELKQQNDQRMIDLKRRKMICDEKVENGWP